MFGGALLPTAQSPDGSRVMHEEQSLTKSMKQILDKSDRLTNRGRDKLIKLLESDLDSKDLGSAFKVTDTILATGSQTTPYSSLSSRNVSPLNSKERRTQFYMRQTFESNLKPRQLEAKLQRGRNLAIQMNQMKLNRIKATNQIIHKPSLDYQNKIWVNSLIEKTFMNRLSSKDLYNDIIKLEQDTTFGQSMERTSQSVDKNPHFSTQRSKIIQDRVASLMVKLDETKQAKLGHMAATKLKMDSESRAKIDHE